MIENSKQFCCLCCRSQPLTMNISLPVEGYVSGQNIPVRINVENQSGIEVKKVNIILQSVRNLKSFIQIF